MTRMAVEKHWSRDYDSCINCGTTERRHKGLGYCKKCYKIHKHDIMPVDVCTKCGRKGKGYKQKESGDFICHSCRASRVQHCGICEKDAKIKLRLGHGVRVCEQCSKAVKPGRCIHCRRSGTVIAQDKDRPICPACFVSPVAMCSVCQQPVKYYKHNPEGKIFCKKCYKPEPKVCILCHKFKEPHKRVFKGHICVECYEKPLRECSICGEQKISHHQTSEGKFVCRDCHYSHLLDLEIARMKGTFSLPWVEKLFLEYLAEKSKIQNSEAVYRAIERDKPLFEQLGEIFSGPAKMSHEKFWRHFFPLHRTRVGQIYAFLIQKGYLPHTDIPTDQFVTHQKILAAIESIPEGFRRPARAYYNKLLKVRQKKLKAGWKPSDHGVGSYDTMENTIKLIQKFVQALKKAKLEGFNEITSDLVDKYIAENQNAGGCTIALMHWLFREKYILWKYKSDWKVVKSRIGKAMTQDKYDALLDKFMSGFYPLKETLLCLFALIYGIRIQTLRVIRIRDLREDGGKLVLKLPYVELELHKKIAVMVQKYLNESSIANVFDIDNPYLFFGYVYQEPMTYSSIRNIFSRHGFQARQIIPTAIRSLFDDNVRHPSIWRKALGIGINTATRYYESFNPTVLEEMNINKRLYGSVK